MNSLRFTYFFIFFYGSICSLSFTPVVSGIRWRNYPNNRPIIGILAQESPTNSTTSNQTSTYIAASYVKFVESGGARVVPIHLGRPEESTTQILDSINGVLIPGGGASLNDSMYSEVGQFIYKYAVERNNAGDYFPIWATCLGFELLVNCLAPKYSNLVECSARDMALPLTFTPDASESRLFADLPSDVFQALTQFHVTANYHRKCLTPQTVKDSGLDEHIHVLSTNYDANNLQFVSTYESKSYPFYAVQWHPEKAPWEWTTQEPNMPHSPQAVRVTQYLAAFFVNEGRKSTHHFKDPKREEVELIYNFRLYYTGKNGSLYEQKYILNAG